MNNTTTIEDYERESRRAESLAGFRGDDDFSEIDDAARAEAADRRHMLAASASIQGHPSDDELLIESFWDIYASADQRVTDQIFAAEAAAEDLAYALRQFVNSSRKGCTVTIGPPRINLTDRFVEQDVRIKDAPRCVNGLHRIWVALTTSECGVTHWPSRWSGKSYAVDGDCVGSAKEALAEYLSLADRA